MISSIQRCPNAQRPAVKLSSAEIIGGNNDLVVEILQRLPAKSLSRFKSVSKTWLSLISYRPFSFLWQQHRQQHQRQSNISGLFFTCRSRTRIKYIPLVDVDDGGQNKSLARFPNMYSINTTIIDSCNGFLLFCLTEVGCCLRSYQVYNPTNKQFRNLPWPFCRTNYAAYPLYLAFDPAKSLHYKVVLLRRLRECQKMENYMYQIHIYSSETNAWRSFGDPFYTKVVDLDNGVFCNGSIHWVSFFSDEASMYFDFDQERLCTMPSPPFPTVNGFRHFGECRGHLHLTGRSVYDTKFNVEVSQMESDYSKWSLKYRVDLNIMVDFVAQEMIVRRAVSLLGLIPGEDEGDVLLVLFVGTNMIISYNIRDNTFKKLLDVAHHPGSSSYELSLYGSCRVYRYIETLFPV